MQTFIWFETLHKLVLLQIYKYTFFTENNSRLQLPRRRIKESSKKQGRKKPKHKANSAWEHWLFSVCQRKKVWWVTVSSIIFWTQIRESFVVHTKFFRRNQTSESDNLRMTKSLLKYSCYDEVSEKKLKNDEAVSLILSILYLGYKKRDKLQKGSK